MVTVAAVMRSASTRIFEMFGRREATMATTSSGSAMSCSSDCFVGFPRSDSPFERAGGSCGKASGFVVKAAESRRTNNSYVLLANADQIVYYLTPISLLILRCSPKFVLPIFSPRMAVNSNNNGKVCR